jgi:hypothetical protein
MLACAQKRCSTSSNTLTFVCMVSTREALSPVNFTYGGAGGQWKGGPEYASRPGGAPPLMVGADLCAWCCCSAHLAAVDSYDKQLNQGTIVCWLPTGGNGMLLSSAIPYSPSRQPDRQTEAWPTHCLSDSAGVSTGRRDRPWSRSGTLAPASGSLQQRPAAQPIQHNPQAGSGGSQQGGGSADGRSSLTGEGLARRATRAAFSPSPTTVIVQLQSPGRGGDPIIGTAPATGTQKAAA